MPALELEPRVSGSVVLHDQSHPSRWQGSDILFAGLDGAGRDYRTDLLVTPLDQLDYCHRRAIALTPAKLDDPRVTSRPFSIPGGYFVEHLFDHSLVRQLGQGQAPVVKRSFLAVGYQFLRNHSGLFGLGQRGGNSLMADQVTR